MPGAFVSVHMETASGSTQLSICEAFVYTDQVCLSNLNLFEKNNNVSIVNSLINTRMNKSSRWK